MASWQNDDLSRGCKKNGKKLGSNSVIDCGQLEAYWNRF